jgi:archaellum component FlaG (FlaF/FlaG flagellin family)
MNLSQNIYIISIIILLIGCNRIKQDESNNKVKKSRNINETEVEIAVKKYNFGKVKSDTIISKMFYVKNIGNSDLFILDSFTSCTCTSSSINKKKVSPGDSLSYSVQIDMNHKKGYTRIVGYLSLNTPKTYYKFIVEGEVE